MAKIKLYAFLILLSFTQALSGQDCGCTIDQVETNTVEPCNLIIGSVDTVYNVSQLRASINDANSNGNKTILIADGTYPVASTASYPYLIGTNIVIRSLSGNRDKVIITGQGMKDVAPATEIGFSLVGDNITIADLTIRDVGNHAISTNSDNHLIHNVRIMDTYEQMIKGTSGGNFSNNCKVQCCLMAYSAGIGPQWYIGGLDIHEGVGWQVHDNVFRNIASPSIAEAEHAIHFWDNSSDNIIERNKIYNCDRGIGFGLGNSPNTGGIIRNNTIFNDGSGMFDDVGIGLESSPNTQVYNNTILIEYPNGIEYRFQSTANVQIVNNVCNKSISSRNGGQANLSSNVTNADNSWFADTPSGDLRLIYQVPNVVDQGEDLGNLVLDDLYKNSRPIGLAIDLGAHEFHSIIDVDMDGFNSDEDCDDMNADINPDGIEIPNNDIDENCDGIKLIIDVDMDGFNSDEDCDDMNANINPEAIEIPNNDIDENCDGIKLIIDVDMDGFNSDEDCDDMNANINPDGIEIPNNGVDEDCDGQDLITSLNNQTQKKISIYPNPANQWLYIEYDQVELLGISIFDLLGQRVLVTHDRSINIGHLFNGVFILKLEFKNNQTIFKKLEVLH